MEEFTKWFNEHDDELILMEPEDIAREAFHAGMKVAQHVNAADSLVCTCGLSEYYKTIHVKTCPLAGR